MCLLYLISAVTRFTADSSWRETLRLSNSPLHLVFSTEWKVGLANGLEGLSKACSSTSHLNEAVVVSAIEHMSVEPVFC